MEKNFKAELLWSKLRPWRQRTKQTSCENQLDPGTSGHFANIGSEYTACLIRETRKEVWRIS